MSRLARKSALQLLAAIKFLSVKCAFFLILLYFVSCTTDTSKKIVDAPFKLNTSRKQLISNFESCLHLTRQLIKKQFSEREFSEYFSLSRRATGFEYENVVLHISDTLSQMPKGYQIFYDFVYKGDTLGSFRADVDSYMKIIDYRNFHLLAFRGFIDKELKITKVTDIAQKNGMERQGLSVVLNWSADRFYWECKNDCDACLYLDVDAKTGNIIGRGKVVYQ